MKRLHGFSEMSALSSMVMLGPAPSAYLLYDTFTGASGNLAGRTPDVGNAWVDGRGVGAWTGVSNAASLNLGTASHEVLYSDTAVGDVSMSLSMTTSSNDTYRRQGFYVRGSDKDNFLRLHVGHVDGSLCFYTMIAAVQTLVTYVSLSVPVSTTFTLTCLVRGDVIVLKCNSTYITWITSQFQSNTIHGLYGQGNAGTGPASYDSIAVVAAPAQTTLASDNFDDGTSVGLSGKADDSGNTWTVYSGATWRTTAAGTLECTTPVDPSYAAVNVSVADVVVSVQGNMASNGHVGIAGRLSDASNAWEIYARHGSNDVVIVENAAGTRTVRSVSLVSLSSSTNYTMKCVFAGASICGSVNSVSFAYHAASSNSTATRFGVVTFSGNANTRFDDFSVKSL